MIVADVDADGLRANGGRWRATVVADLATSEGVDAAVAEVLRAFERAPDILVNNLGVGDATPFEDITDERWARSIDVNLMGTVRTCRALVPKMAAHGAGVVVNIGSDLAKQPEPALVDYGACKAALLYVTKALARQYARGACEHGAARADLVADVDAARWDRRSARRELWPAARSGRRAIPSGSPDAHGNRQRGRCGPGRGVPGVAARRFITGASLDSAAPSAASWSSKRILPATTRPRKPNAGYRIVHDSSMRSGRSTLLKRINRLSLHGDPARVARPLAPAHAAARCGIRGGVWRRSPCPNT